jgi:sorting and assembly machinery component 37
MLYSLDANWNELTHPALVSMLPVPHKYYVPSRLRERTRPRLEAAGLWNLPGIEQEKEASKPSEPTSKDEVPDDKKTFLRVFEREKVCFPLYLILLSSRDRFSQVLDKARAFFDIYARLLGQKSTFFAQ